MLLVKIKRADPVRNAIAGIKTYHDSKGHAFRAVQRALVVHGYRLACEGNGVMLDHSGDEGRKALELCMDGNDCASDLIFIWYTMWSGRIELTCYIS